MKNFNSYPHFNATKIETLNHIKNLNNNNFLTTLENFICFGNGMSYSDCALGNKIFHIKFNNFLNFNENLGLLEVQSGVLLSEIIESFLPRGYFLQVSPGTKFITVGGAIASDVHGKNHHNDGCFSNFVEEIKIMIPNGEILTLTRTQNADLFYATCGGMGLTGIILSAKIYLKKITSFFINQCLIKTNNLEETFKVFEQNTNYKYSVAWIDCLSTGKNLGKSIVMLGDFAKISNLNYKPKKKLNIPFYFPSFVINKFSVACFNKLYYAKNKDGNSQIEFEEFFFPLDKISNWNRIYGKNGFLQYQFILPLDKSFGIYEILSEIAKYKKSSFLAVLKLYGEQNDNLLSFPIQGYSLAVDFKIENEIFSFLDKLDSIVARYEGRIYLAKDARMKREIFEAGYQRVNEFRKIRKKYNLEKIQSLQSIRLGL